MGQKGSKSSGGNSSGLTFRKAAKQQLSSSSSSASTETGFSWQQTKSVAKKLDRETIDVNDFIVKDRVDETIIRKPGEICGEQFIIENCTNCDIYLLDHSATITIDNCKNCRFFIGPMASSVFIRTTEDCKFGALACQQFRTRQCKNLDVLLYAQTRPIIEMSSNIRLGCFNAYYVELVDQFAFSRLSVFNNNWSTVYDFTPADTLNYSYLPTGTKYTDLVSPISTICPEVLSEEQENNLVADGQTLVPLTPPTDDKTFDYAKAILFLPGFSEDASQFVRLFYATAEAKESKVVISRAKEWKFKETDAKQMFKNSPDASKAQKQVPKGATIAIKVSGNTDDVNSVLQKLSQGLNKSAYYIPESKEETRNVIEYIFNIHTADVS